MTIEYPSVGRIGIILAPQQLSESALAHSVDTLSYFTLILCHKTGFLIGLRYLINHKHSLHVIVCIQNKAAGVSQYNSSPSLILRL